MCDPRILAGAFSRSELFGGNETDSRAKRKFRGFEKIIILGIKTFQKLSENRSFRNSKISKVSK